MRERALSNLVSAFARSAPQRARALYLQLPEGPRRDRAGAGLAMQIAGRDSAKLRDVMEDLGISQEYIQSHLTVYAR